MKNIVCYLLPLLVVPMFYMACNEAAESNKKDLQGRWELYAAQRNNQPTPTFEGVFFRFEQDKMESNFPSQPSIPYTVSVEIGESTIKNIDQPEVIFDILPDDYKDTLQLSTTLMDNLFALQLRRVE